MKDAWVLFLIIRLYTTLPKKAREPGTVEPGERSEPQPVSSKEKGKAPIQEVE